MNSKQLRIGMVGYKFMGKAHSNAYQRLGMFFDPGVRVVQQAVCGRDAHWVARSAQTLGWNSWETSWQKLIDRDDIDVVDITTPSNAHKDIAVAAAQAGKHVFCEKPLALTLEDARQMLEAANQAGINHQVGFNYRFCPAVLLAKQMVDTGKLGEIYHFRGHYLQDWIIDPDFPLVWRLDKEVAGSGAHGDLGAHVIDTARFLCGEFHSVTGMSKTFVTQRPVVEQMEGLSGKAQQHAPRRPVLVDDATLFVAQLKSGALATIESTRFAQGHKNNMGFEINGSKGSIRFSFERMNELEYYNAEDPQELQGFRLIQVSQDIHPYWSHWWPPGHVIGYEHTFVHELHEFVQNIAHQRPCTPDFEDGVKCSQILEAVELSVARRAWVEVDSL